MNAHPPEATPLAVRDLNVAYQTKVVVWDADFDAPAGKLVPSSARTVRARARC